MGRERERVVNLINPSSPPLLLFYLTKDVVSSLVSEVLAVSIPVAGISPLLLKMLISS